MKEGRRRRGRVSLKPKHLCQQIIPNVCILLYILNHALVHFCKHLDYELNCEIVDRKRFSQGSSSKQTFDDLTKQVLR